MLNKKPIVIFILFMAFGKWSFGQYTGGANDGYSSGTFCGNDLNGTSSPAITLGLVGGLTNTCNNWSSNYSIAVTSGSSPYFNWTGPSGSSIAGQINSFTLSQVSIAFAATNGNVTVTATNGCTSASAFLAVTLFSCNNTLGGNNDGYNSGIFCGNNLNGSASPAITLSTIVGSIGTCNNLSDNYSVTLTAGSSPYFNWAGPSGSSIAGQVNTFTSSQVSIAFATTGGNVTVSATNGCTVASASLAITLNPCNNFLGGNNDGYSSGIFCGNDLNGSASPAITLSAIAGSANTCNTLSDNYSVSVTAGSSPYYNWAGPSGSSVVGEINTFNSSQATIAFATSNGNVTVSATNGCTVASVSLAITLNPCNISLGGINDGFSSGIFCGNDLTGTTAPGITLNPITGSGTNCTNLGDNYSISLASGGASNYYWSGPTGSIVSGTTRNSTSSTASISFGLSSGNIFVTVDNGCSNATAFLAVALIACNTTFGGINDGFSTGSFCGNDLNGTGATAITLNAISGSSTVCFNYGQNYSVSNASGSATNYAWSGPTGTTVGGLLNTFTSSLATVNLGSTSGNISVTASNACSTATVSLAVTGANCFTSLGGINDGFNVGTGNIALPVILVDFNAKVVSDEVKLYWITDSELNNDFFTIERSLDGKTFSFLAKTEGAGTSSKAHNYSIIDTSPYEGISYYRLSQTDFDGKVEYLGVVAVNVSGKDDFGLEVFPNPIIGKIVNMTFSQNWWNRSAQLQITDVIGNPIITASFIIGPEKQLNIQNNNLSAGLYIIVIHVNNQKLAKKIVVP